MIIDRDGASLRLTRDFIGSDESQRLLSELIRAVSWRRDTITVHGRTSMVPRLHQFFGDAGMVYRWSGLRMSACPWIDSVRGIRDRVQQATGATFNVAMLNLYRDGNDCVGWHADDERELGDDPIIASVSLGAARDFMLRRKSAPVSDKLAMPLTSGSLLIMSGATQRTWEHSVPRRVGVHLPRVNLTFRRHVR